MNTVPKNALKSFSILTDGRTLRRLIVTCVLLCALADRRNATVLCFAPSPNFVRSSQSFTIRVQPSEQKQEEERQQRKQEQHLRHGEGFAEPPNGDQDGYDEDAPMLFAESDRNSEGITDSEANVDIITTETVSDAERKLPYAKRIAELLVTPRIELADAGLVLLSSTAAAVGTLPSSPDAIFQVENGLSYVFCFGFFLRWYAIGNLSPLYFTKPLPLLDLFASFMPFILEHAVFADGVGLGALVDAPSWIASDNSALVNLRLLRILRLQELLVDEDTFAQTVGPFIGARLGDVRPYQLQLARVLIDVLTLLSVASGLIYSAEHSVNPDIPDYFAALYFGLTTLTTVGFGDIAPITLPGRLVVMGSILVGVAVIPGRAAELVEALLDFQEERKRNSAESRRSTRRVRGDDDDRRRSATSSSLTAAAEAESSMIDPRIACAACGRRSHRGDAIYCWSCGSKLWQ